MSKMRYGTFVTTGQPPGMSEGWAFDEAVAHAHAAENLGYRDVWVLEHHFTPFGLCGDALTLAAYLLGATSTIDVGTAVTVVPLDHPIRLAERVAMIDHLSGGRLLFGIGRGDFPREFEALGRDVSESHLMIREGWEALKGLWAGPYSNDGRFWPFGQVNTLPKPLSIPYPKAYAAASSPSSVEWAARNGLPLLLLYYLEDEVKRSIVDLHADVTRECGGDPSLTEHALSCVAHVADTTEQAQEDVLARYLWWIKAGGDAIYELPDRPERREINYGFHYARRDEAILRGARDIDVYNVERLFALNPIGSVDLCVDRIVSKAELLGVNHIICGFEGVSERSGVIESMARFMSEVVPAVEQRQLVGGEVSVT
ncbi:MAG TPA: LLM class flavin-dependent oxidoreductase [Acidimicrobiales bacterium]|jgi:alkanal monooxygenase alpha chain|nr:LLM class flavin-dependent oxidoreductase [Acidimicrobiales bacterium]